MALRSEDLAHAVTPGAVVLAFPTERVRRRARAQARMLARRRRTTAVATVLAIVIALMLATGPGGTAPASAPGAPRKVTLQAGESYWDIAERFAPPSVDLRAYVDALADVNGAAPAAGARIRLP